MSARASYDDIHDELSFLAVRLMTGGAGDVLEDEKTVNFLLRMVEAHVDLLSAHALDANDRCMTCGRKRSCPVGEMFPAYVAGWTASGGVESAGSSSMSVNAADPRRWRRARDPRPEAG